MRRKNAVHCYRAVPRSTNTFLSELLSCLLPAVLLFGLWGWLARRMAAGQVALGGLLEVGKSHARIHRENEVKVSFADVAGVDAQHF